MPMVLTFMHFMYDAQKVYDVIGSRMPNAEADVKEIYSWLDPYRGHPCVICSVEHEVCCDSGYTENPDGTTEHDDPMGVGCCTNYHGPARNWPTYERMDCDS